MKGRLALKVVCMLMMSLCILASASSPDGVVPLFEWIDTYIDAVATFFGLPYNEKKKEQARLDRIRLEEARVIAAERLIRDNDAKSRRAREESKMAREAVDNEKRIRLEKEELERVEHAFSAFQTKVESISADMEVYSCPGTIIRTFVCLFVCFYLLIFIH